MSTELSQLYLWFSALICCSSQSGVFHRIVIFPHVVRSRWYTSADIGPPWFSSAPAPQTSLILCHILYSLSSSPLLLGVVTLTTFMAELLSLNWAMLSVPLQKMQEDLSPFPTTQELMGLKLGTLCALYSALFPPLGRLSVLLTHLNQWFPSWIPSGKQRRSSLVLAFPSTNLTPLSSLGLTPGIKKTSH